MIKEPEAASVYGKANTLKESLLSMISAQEPATPPKIKPTTPVGSPRTLAVKRTEIEIEYMEEAAQMDQAIQRKENELRSEQSYEDSQKIEGELKVLKVS